MSSLPTKPLVQHHLSRVSPIQLRNFPLRPMADSLCHRSFFSNSQFELQGQHAGMVKSEAVKASLCGCATRTPLKGHYNELRTVHHRMLLRIIEAWCKSPNNRILSHKGAFQRTGCESIEAIERTRSMFWSGALLHIGDHRLPKRFVSGEQENAV